MNWCVKPGDAGIERDSPAKYAESSHPKAYELAEPAGLSGVARSCVACNLDTAIARFRTRARSYGPVLGATAARMPDPVLVAPSSSDPERDASHEIGWSANWLRMSPTRYP